MEKGETEIRLRAEVGFAIGPRGACVSVGYFEDSRPLDRSQQPSDLSNLSSDYDRTALDVGIRVGLSGSPRNAVRVINVCFWVRKWNY